MMLGAGIAIIGLVAGASYYEGLKPGGAIEHPAPAPLPVRPCDWIREIDLQQHAARWWAAVEASLRNAPLTDTQTTMSDSVDEAFAPAYDRIPEFLVQRQLFLPLDDDHFCRFRSSWIEINNGDGGPGASGGFRRGAAGPVDADYHGETAVPVRRAVPSPRGRRRPVSRRGRPGRPRPGRAARPITAI